MGFCAIHARDSGDGPLEQLSFSTKDKKSFSHYRSEYATSADGWTPRSYTRAVVLQQTRANRTACWVMTEKSFGNYAWLEASGSCILKMGPRACPETSVRIYHYSLRNDPEERSSVLSRNVDGKVRLQQTLRLCFVRM